MNLTIEQMRKIVDEAPAMAKSTYQGKAGYRRMGSVLLVGAIQGLWGNALRDRSRRPRPHRLCK